jgi:hypothetical protein
MATRMTGHAPSKKILFRVARIAALVSVVAAWSIFAPIHHTARNTSKSFIANSR